MNNVESRLSDKTEISTTNTSTTYKNHKDFLLKKEQEFKSQKAIAMN